jgi:hypothetical protein
MHWFLPFAMALSLKCRSTFGAWLLQLECRLTAVLSSLPRCHTSLLWHVLGMHELRALFPHLKTRPSAGVSVIIST